MKKIAAGIFAGLLALPALSRAADTNDVAAASAGTNQVVTLPEVTVTATRVPAAPENTPGSVTIISAGQIAQSQQHLITDVLRGVPGV